MKKLEKHLHEVYVGPAEVAVDVRRPVVRRVRGEWHEPRLGLGRRLWKSQGNYHVTWAVVYGPRGVFEISVPEEDPILCRVRSPRPRMAVACRYHSSMSFFEYGLLLYDDPAMAIVAAAVYDYYADYLWRMGPLEWKFDEEPQYTRVAGCVDFDGVEYRPGTCIRGVRAEEAILSIPYLEL